MRFSGFACLVTVLAASMAAGASPAAAQVLPMDLFKASEPVAAPPTIESAARGFNLSAAPLPTASFRPLKPPPAPEPPMEEARAEPEENPAAPPPVAPLPPQRAASPRPAPQEPLEITPRPVVTAAAGPASVAAVEPLEPLSNRAIVERANAYFTNLGSLVVDFTQIGGDGRKLGGTLYLQRPGKVRFEYDPPATLEVIADGSSVAVRDKKLATQDLYSISQTPLKFLLRERVNLGQDIAINGITSDRDSVRVSLEDRSTLGGTSRITLYFDPKVETLTQWRIVDPQGFQTSVVLNKAERGRRIEQDLFKIQYEAILGGSNR